MNSGQRHGAGSGVAGDPAELERVKRRLIDECSGGIAGVLMPGACQVLTARLSGHQVIISGNAPYPPSPSRLRSLSARSCGQRWSARSEAKTTWMVARMSAQLDPPAHISDAASSPSGDAVPRGGLATGRRW